MAGNGIGLYAQRLGHDDRVEEYGGLRHFGLLELLVRTGEHDVGDAEAENLVGLLEEGLRLGYVFVEVLAHAYGLSTLTRKYVCVFHDFQIIFVCVGKDTNLFSKFAPQWFTKSSQPLRVIKWECREIRQQFPLL